MSAPVSESSEARQKFSNAKAISSDMFFGRESSTEVGTLTVVVFILIKLEPFVVSTVAPV